MVESLYREHRRTHPERFSVGWKDETRKDHLGRSEKHPCANCIVEHRNVKDCDPCFKNPDRQRMKRSGLL